MKAVKSMLKEYQIHEHEDRTESVLKWGQLLSRGYDTSEEEVIEDNYETGGDTRPDFRKLPKVYAWFILMDLHIPPDLYRCFRRKKQLRKELEEMKLVHYQKVLEDGMKIIVERNSSNPNYPIVYVRDQSGERYDFIDLDCSELLCMDIYIKDSAFQSPMRTLAVLIFYMEYPLRTRRIQKAVLRAAIRGILMKHKTEMMEE